MIESDAIIYLDNNATTQADPAVVEEMLPFLTGYYGNPSSPYGFGRQVREAVELARERVAALVGCTPAEIVFTSGGTESNNTAINSALQLDRQRNHIVTTAVEHSAIRKHCQHLSRNGIEVTVVGVDSNGALDLNEFEAAIRTETAVVSAMWANNETGVLFPISDIAEIARRKRVLFHTDAVQAAGKVPISARDTPLNFLSLASHKIHGPKGAGALYVNARTAFRPSFFGGTHENNRRAGTENVAGIVGFGKAAELAAAAASDQSQRVREMRDLFEQELLRSVGALSVNGGRAPRLPNTSSLSFAGIESDAVLLLLDQRGVCCSAGSACLTGSVEQSHVLRAMDLPQEFLRGSLRFSFSRFNRDSDAQRAAEMVRQVVERLRSLRGAGVVRHANATTAAT